MSTCNNCSRFRNIPICTESLIIGTLTGLANTNVYVFLKNHTTGYTYRFSATTTLYGGLTLDLTNSGYFVPTPNHDYELWVILQSSMNTDERINISIDTVNYLCAGFTFENIFVDASVIAEYTTQTLKLKS
jgi:hypothetical protein